MEEKPKRITPKARLLILEDEPAQRQILTEIFTEEGYEVITADTAERALHHLRNHGRFSAAIIDLQLPDIRGPALLTHLAPYADHMPIIINTAYHSYETARDAVNVGVFAYVEKAGNPDELVRQVQRATQHQMYVYAERLEQAVAQRAPELQQSEEKLRLALEATNDGVWDWQVQSGQVYYSLNWAKMLGQEAVDPKYHTWESRIHPDDKDRVLRSLKAHLEGKTELWHAEHRLRTQSNHWKWVLGRGRVLRRDDQGSPIRMIGTIADISERKEAEVALRESEARYRELFENMTSGAAVYEVIDGGRDFIFKDFNRAGEQIDGQKRGDLIGRSIFDVRPGAEAFGLIEAFRKALVSDRPVHHPVALYQDDRLARWYDNYIYALPSGELVAVFDDVTEKKQAEEALRESETRYALAQRAAHIGIWEWSPAADTVYWSEEIEPIFGFNIGDFDGRLETVQSRIHPEDVPAWKESIRQCLENQIDHDLEYRVIWPDGSVHWVHALGNMSPQDQGTPEKMVGILSDITERKKQELKIMDYQRQLRQLASELALTEERLRRDVATQLHDTISQSLAMIKVEVSSLRTSLSDEALWAPLDRIKESLSRTLQESRALTSALSYPVLNVLGFEKAVEKWISEQAEEKFGLQAIFENDAQDKPLDEDIQAVLFRGVRELFMNTVKHARASRIAVSLRRSENQIVVELEDDGLGCDLEETLGKSEGFGLLSLHEALNRLRGRLQLESQVHAGFKATMTAPLNLDTRLDTRNIHNETNNC